MLLDILIDLPEFAEIVVREEIAEHLYGIEDLVL
jgi:hypothetical protein